MNMAGRVRNSWAEMSEEWAAEETGRLPRRIVTFPTRIVLDDNAMDLDLDDDLSINASYSLLKRLDSDSQKSEEDDFIPHHSYAVTVKRDPRPEICYDELVSPPKPTIPRSMASKFKIHVDFDNENTDSTSIKSRLGLNQAQQKLEEGELLDDDSEEDFDNEKDNLEGGWSKRLIGPRMRMYADEEVEKKKKQDMKTRTRLHRGHSSTSDSKGTRSMDQLRRIQPYGIQVDKHSHDISRKIPIKERLGRRVDNEDRVRR